eukprot:s2511_g1.t1
MSNLADLESLRVSGAIKAETCEELVAFLKQEFHRSLKSADGRVATVRNWAAAVAMDPVIYKALEEMLRWDGPEEGLGGALASLAGLDSRLWALHAAMSMPGAAAGRVRYADTPGLYTAAIALEDVSYDMGPVHFWPGTNTPLAHEHFEQGPREFLDQREPAAPLLKAGDAVIYDEQTLRCESENRSTKPLPLLFVTFLSTHGGEDTAASPLLLPSLHGRFRLRHFRPELNVIFHSSRGLHKKGDRIIGEIHITLPAFEKLRQRAGPLLRHVEREESLLAKSSELLSEASEGAAKSRTPR